MTIEKVGSSLFSSVVSLIAVLIPPLQAAVRRIAEQERERDASRRKESKPSHYDVSSSSAVSVVAHNRNNEIEGE